MDGDARRLCATAAGFDRAAAPVRLPKAATITPGWSCISSRDRCWSGKDCARHRHQYRCAGGLPASPSADLAATRERC